MNGCTGHILKGLNVRLIEKILKGGDLRAMLQRRVLDDDNTNNETWKNVWHGIRVLDLRTPVSFMIRDEIYEVS